MNDPATGLDPGCDRDREYMQLAISLAERGLYTTSPNPRVGCVLVRDGRIIGQGYHLRAGEGHAEVNALADAGEAVGATAYVTLEPCSHVGRTAACADALITAKVSRVVMAMLDPNPQVSGAGRARLEAAGITVDSGLLADQAAALNLGFIKRMTTGLPWLRLKMAMSLDGRTAMASGESQWITGPDARRDVQRLRARSCAIISSRATVAMDNASLTVRVDELGLDAEQAQLAAQQQPLRVVLDSRLKLSPAAKLFAQPGPILMVGSAANQSAQRALEQAGAEVMVAADDSGQVDLEVVLRALASRSCNEVLIEAGATLAGALVAAGLVDHYTIYMAATLLGSDARPLLTLPLASMAQQQRLQIESITPVGKDWRIDARPHK